MVVIDNISPKLQIVKNFVRPLFKKRRFGTRFDSQHVKVSRILAKSPREHFYHVFSSFWGKLIWKMSPLVLGEILGVFVNTLTADGKYPVQDWENLLLSVKMKLSDNWKIFLKFLFHFWNLHNILNISKKKMVVIGNVFPKLQTVKNFVRPLCKKQRFGTRLDSQHGKVTRILAESHESTFIMFFHHSERSWFGKCLSRC